MHTIMFLMLTFSHMHKYSILYQPQLNTGLKHIVLPFNVFNVIRLTN